MKEIPLNNGKIAIVDDDVFDYLNQWKWCYVHNGYAKRNVHRNGKWISIYMHREILQPSPGLFIDHINCNKLDNRITNLRICSRSENGMNRGKNKNNTTGKKGVTFHKRLQLYAAQIKKDNQIHHLGYFNNIDDAAKAYFQKAKELFGEYANIG